MNIIEFIRDPLLINGNLSAYQATALRLLYGLELSEEQKEIAKAGLGVEELPEAREYPEATYICGRRSGKSDRLGANIAVYEAVCGEHQKQLARGERGRVVIVAQDKRAARNCFHYVLAKLQDSKWLSQFIDTVKSEEIDLSNGLTISIFPCSYRAVRGYSVPVAILDELAFYRVEGVNVDKEVVNAIRPAQATFPRSKLIKISSPYSKAGELYRDYASRDSRRSSLLCFKAASWEMNPSIPKVFLEEEKARDPEFFSREYAAEFTDTISSAFTREAVESCIVHGRYELPYLREFFYVAGIDPSGGGADEFTLSICHRENDRILQDCLRAFRSKKPQDVVAEMASTMAAYGIKECFGDRYSGEWVRSAFRDKGVTYNVADLTASEAFLELLPLVNQGAIELLDDSAQTNQLIALERRKTRTGKDQLGHPPGGHDDRANALALAAARLDSRAGARAVAIESLGIW